MPSSAKMFVEQTNVPMAAPIWLHVNGVSLTSDVHHYHHPLHSYDYRAKHLQSPIQSPTLQQPASLSMPLSTSMIEEVFPSNQQLEHVDSAKKLFLDRQIKKAKSLPGLIKGTALSRNTPLHSATFTSPAPSLPPPPPPPHGSLQNIHQDDSLPLVTNDNDGENLHPSQFIQQQHETRRPRVYFADYNKVQFYDDNNNEFSSHQSGLPNHTHRHRRRRSSKRSTGPGARSIQPSPPSIQQPQVLLNYSRPLSRQQQPIANELSIKKQQILASPRIHSSRVTHLPEILNQSLPLDTSLNDSVNSKFILQREKPIMRIPKPAAEIPISSSAEMSRESTRAGGPRFSPQPEHHTYGHESGSGGGGAIINGYASSSASSTTRQRSLRTISLRQQFISPVRLKLSGTSTTTTAINNAHHSIGSNANRRSASLKQSSARLHANNDEQDLSPSNAPTLLVENRPMTGVSSSGKQLKRSYVIHFNPKNPIVGNGTADLNETNRSFLRSHFHEPTEERFQNLLTVVRPPYTNGTNGAVPSSTTIIPGTDSIQSTTMTNQNTNGNFRSSRVTSGRGPLDLHVGSNTVTV